MDQALLIFITVAEKGNFTRAAEELHMTQPAVSQYIQTLERTTGAKLLERTNKYVRLTKAGEIIYHYAKEIRGLYTRMQSLVDDVTHKASGSLSIGASYTFGEYVLPHVIAHMRGIYPLIEPAITIGNTREIAESVLSHQLDIGIIEGNYRHERLHTESFAEDLMYVVVSDRHPLADLQEISAVDLRKETWIVREQGSGTREATDTLFSSQQWVPENLMEFGSTQIIKESVEAGLGITLLSYWTVRKELALGTLKLIESEGIPVTRKFSLVIPKTEYHTKALEVFLEVLRMKQGIPQWERTFQRK